MTRILTFDVETMPMEVRAFQLFDQNIGIDQIRKMDWMACFAAKFSDERKVRFHSVWGDGPRGMAAALHKLFDDADVVMGWNSNSFDVRWANRVFQEIGRSPPSPVVRLDLMRAVKRKFRLPSYRLDYVARWLGVGRKVRTGGFPLWDDVMEGDKTAMRHMETYNKGDVTLTEKVFDVLVKRGWVDGLPNQSVLNGMVCPACASDHYIKSKRRISRTRMYQQYQCKDCGKYFSDVHSEPERARFKEVA